MESFDLLMLMGLRWLHLIFGVTWVGMLFYFNFVNVSVMKKLDAATKLKVIPELMPRALFFFRWGAMGTLFTGLAYLDKTSNHFSAAYFNESTGQTILVGILLGCVMFFNVWFVIWPRQKKIIAATIAQATNGTQPPPEMARWARVAYLASRTNTYLSFPMLFFMGAASHFPHKIF